MWRGALKPVWLSVIIPVLNEEKGLTALLEPLQAWRDHGVELLLCDGGSQDDTVALAEPWVDELVICPAGRARQMNAGARQARAPLFLFLHADSRFLADPLPALKALAVKTGSEHGLWGWFRVCLSGADPRFRMIERFMRWRSRLSGIATGDQGLFVSRDLFESLGGYEPLQLMEDVRLSRRLKAKAKPQILPTSLETSSRRWERRGIWRTVLLMWRIRFAFFMGVPACRLWEDYYGRS